MEVTNVWKIFSDVNYDATMLVARKRVTPIVATELTHAASDRSLNIKAIGRGKSEADKLKQIAEGTWTISHTTTHGFQCKQARHRFEVIFEPNIADELDRITARCKRLDQVADVTVGIQVYYDGPEGVYTPEGVSQHDQSSRRSARATWPMIPIPAMDATTAGRIGCEASKLQAHWQALRSDLSAVDAALGDNVTEHLLGTPRGVLDHDRGASFLARGNQPDRDDFNGADRSTVVDRDSKRPGPLLMRSGI